MWLARVVLAGRDENRTLDTNDGFNLRTHDKATHIYLDKLLRVEGSVVISATTHWLWEDNTSSVNGLPTIGQIYATSNFFN